MNELILFLLSAFFTGILAKLVDLKYDNGLKIPDFLALPFGFVYGFLIAFVVSKSEIMAPLWLGIVLGLLIANKIDAPGHYFGIASLLFFLALFGIPKLNIFLLVLFAALCILEELLNKYIDALNKIKRKKLIFRILKYRPILEISVLVASIITGHWIMFFMLFCFDAGYITTDYLGKRIK